MFAGFGMAFAFKVLMQALKLWDEYPKHIFEKYKGAVLSLEASPILLGVGYIIGPRIASVTVAGGLLAAMVLTPAITLFGDQATQPIFAVKTIHEMKPAEIHKAYVLYSGAGAVATGGIISLIQALPLILGSIRSGLGDIGAKGGKAGTGRTDRDLPFWVVVVGSLGLVVALSMTHLIPTDLPGRIAGAIMILVFGFLFVTVSSRLTGEIGSSSNPISGMTVATLLLTCLIFVLAGWVGPEFRLAALSIAGVVCIASSNGGTTSQDLKTGYLIGATPAKQQIAILIGALSSSIVIGFALLLMNNVSTIYTKKAEFLPTIAAPAALTETTSYEGVEYKVWRVVEPIKGAQPGKYLVDGSGKAVILVDPAINGRVDVKDDGTKVQKYDAPKATLMALIIDGIMTNRLPWSLVLIGVMIAIVAQLSGVPVLAFAVGVYLPLSTSMPIFVGGMVRALVERGKKKTSEVDADSSPAVLLASGYIAGGAIAGILIAGLAVIPGAAPLLDLSRFLPKEWNESPIPSLVAFGSVTLVLYLTGAGLMFKDSSKKIDASEGVSHLD